MNTTLFMEPTRRFFFEDVEVYLRSRLLYSGAYLGKEYPTYFLWSLTVGLIGKHRNCGKKFLTFKSFEKVVRKNKMAFDALSPKTVLLSPQEERLTAVEKYATIELSKILHFIGSKNK